MEQKGGDWYKGTANAIYRNIGFIEQYDPEYVLVISGDHIYKMDYDLMLSYHKEKKADATIAVIEVKWEETSRFGIMSVNDKQEITEFAEKPKEANSNLASMGIYIFNWKVLKSYLLEDEANPDSSKDFGKDIIPMMLKDEARMFAYPFEGYWKDVGTIDSLWEANMDLLDDNNELNLNDKDWRVYTPRIRTSLLNMWRQLRILSVHWLMKAVRYSGMSIILFCSSVFRLAKAAKFGIPSLCQMPKLVIT